MPDQVLHLTCAPIRKPSCLEKAFSRKVGKHRTSRWVIVGLSLETSNVGHEEYKGSADTATIESRAWLRRQEDALAARGHGERHAADKEGTGELLAAVASMTDRDFEEVRRHGQSLAAGCCRERWLEFPRGRQNSQEFDCS